MDRKESFERSNAFVDGELERQDRSRVLEAAARDSRLARELSNLDRLKSAIEKSVDAPDIDLPAPPGGRTGRRRAVMALAACLVLFAAAGVAWSIFAPITPDYGVEIAWTKDQHNSWKGAKIPFRAGAVIRPANARLGAHVPDLSAARLRIAHIGQSETPDGRPALVVGYRGTRGCRVTLIVDRAPARLDGKAVLFKVDGLIAMVWRAGRLRHVILAEGMAEPRFRLIADTVRRASLERLPIDDPTRTALARSRAQTPPCAT